MRVADVAGVVGSAENKQLGAWAGLRCDASDKAALPNACKGADGGGVLIPSIILNVQRQPGANVIATVDAIKKQLPTLQAGLPASVRVDVLADRTSGIRASVNDVEMELLLAVVLVVLVIFAFLGSLRATVIASIAVPISLVGSFGVMYLLGYSLNNLSLMALTIATGFVVDDAIVMIENIARYIEDGEPPMAAAIKGATQIGFTIISLTDLADRRADSAAVHERRRRAAVPRVRRDARHHDPDLGRRVADARADDVGALAEARDDEHARRARSRAYATLYDRLTHATTGARARCSTTSGSRCWWRSRRCSLTVLLYVTIPKGLFPTQDTGQLQGARRRRAGRVVRPDGAAAAGRRAGDPRRPRRRKPQLDRRRRRARTTRCCRPAAC